jgi:hypothetical protein
MPFTLLIHFSSLLNYPGQYFYEMHLLDRLDPVQALWLAQRWLRGLPTWREDCRVAGAKQAAEGRKRRELCESWCGAAARSQ